MTDLVQLLRDEAERQEILFNDGEATTVGNGYDFMRKAADEIERLTALDRQNNSDLSDKLWSKGFMPNVGEPWTLEDHDRIRTMRREIERLTALDRQNTYDLLDKCEEIEELKSEATDLLAGKDEEIERLTAKLAIAKEEVKVGDSEFALCQAENERLRAERDKFQKAWLRVDAERLDLKLANHNLWAALDVLRQSGGDRCSGYRYYWVDEAGDKLIREALQDKDHDTD